MKRNKPRLTRPYYIFDMVDPIKEIEDDSIVYLADGNQTYSEILEQISKAENSIYVQMFSWRDDVIGNIVAQRLLEAADRGVKVTIIKDKAGVVHEKSEEKKQSFFHNDFDLKVYLMEKLYNVWWYNDISDHSYSSWPQIPNSLPQKLMDHPNIMVEKENVLLDHSKFYIFDDRVLIVGGMNIEDKERWQDYKGRIWRDMMIKLEGDEYVQMVRNRRTLSFNVNEKSLINVYVNRKVGGVMTYEILPKIIDLLQNAKHDVQMICGNWGDQDLHDAVLDIHRRNPKISVTLYVPGDANHSHHLNIKQIRKIYEKDRNLNIHLTWDMIHGKGMLIDNRYLFVGSANFNMFGMKIVQETNLLIDGKGLSVLTQMQDHINLLKRRSLKVRKLEDVEYNGWYAFLEELPAYFM